MVKATINKILETWDKGMFTPITVRNTHWFSHTTDILKPSLKLLVQSKYLLTTNHFQEAEEVSYLSSSTLEQSTPFQDSEDGHTMSGLELWSGITNIWLLSILDILKLDISLISLVQSSPPSTMCTLDMRLNNSLLNGLMFAKKSNSSIWLQLESSLSTSEFTMNMTL